MSDSFEEHFDRAKRALAEGWADQALVPATEAVKLAPTRADARVLLARAWLGNAGWARAISDARAALDLTPAPSEAAAAYDVIGRASLRTHAAADAEAALKEARRLSPSPQLSALLAGVFVDAGRTTEAATLATDEAARIDEAWRPSQIGFAALASALQAKDPPAAAVPLALADMFFDVGLFEEAKARYQLALAKAPPESADSLSERAADGLRALAAGNKTRARPSVQVKPVAAAGQRARRMRLLTSALGGTISIVTLAQWQKLEPYGVLRSVLALLGLAVVVGCVVLARRDDVERKRAAEIAGAGGSEGAS